MPPGLLAVRQERLELYIWKAEEAEKKAASVDDSEVREIWTQIARARRALVKRVSDDLDEAGRAIDGD